MAKAKEKKTETENSNVRKYINFALMMIAIVLVVLIACKLYTTYKENKLGESVFTRFVGSIQYDDIENATKEMGTDGFILISYTKNEDVKKFESSLKKAISNNNLQDSFYYLDATELKLEEGYIATLNKKFNLSDQYEIEELPAILYYRDGSIMKTLSSTSTEMITVDDFNKLLDNYEILGTPELSE
jgi:hypothetical protein